ncbi:glycosyltransferase family 4 protein [Allorhizobium undicola]|uniref:glycosyltransferase family 4 protein n=1 Tax=Allorhizobium undicola TaxID=78527 RepID=UPI003D344C21
MVSKTSAPDETVKQSSPKSDDATCLSILAPTRYPWSFNAPRSSRHKIENRNFAPMNYVSPKLEGITMFQPWPLKRFDLVHAFNRIPLTQTPFVISFESHMPRGFGIEHTGFYRFMTNRLLSDRCVGIGAISNHARRIFLQTHRNHPQLDILRRKLFLRYPNIPIENRRDDHDNAAMDPIKLVFVGNHFGRKGGCVGLRMAELALERGISLEVSIISSMETGAASWTDPLTPGYFDRYRQMLRLPNVRHYQNLPNGEVLAILKRSHFSLLTTFCDTFGFSAIESMANYVPVIATRQAALPEFIAHGKNGIMLDMQTNAIGEWKHIGANRSTPEFADVFSREIERMAEQSLEAVTTLARDRNRYAAMREAAYATARTMFSADDANRFWDDFYVEAWQAYHHHAGAHGYSQGPFTGSR